VSPLSSLLTSIYGVWNAETTATTLATSAYSAWNGDGLITNTQLSASMSNAWQGASSFSATNCATITASMSNLWKADNNFNDSIGGQTGTSPSGSAPAFATGKLGQAFSFDGVNDYVSFPPAALSLTGDFTISLWVNPTQLRNGQYIFTNYTLRSSDHVRFGWQISTGAGSNITFTWANNSVHQSVTAAVPLLAGVWQLITVVRTAATTNIYVNGTLSGSTANTISIAYNTNTKVSLGAYTYITWSDNTTATRDYFLGLIDDVGVWTRGLTDNEVLGLYENGNGQQYPYSNPTTLVLDSFGTAKGLLRGGATFSTGKVGNSLSFNGSSYVDLPVGTLNKTADFSVALWVYPTVNNTTMSLISCRDGVYGWNIEYVSGNLWFWAGSGSNIQLQTGHTISLNTWTHILITFKAGVSTKSYINGVLTNTVSLVGKPSYYDNYSPYYLPIIGAQRYQSPYSVKAEQKAFFTGKLDAIGLWDRELTATEASAIYNTGSGNEYPFTAVSVASANDSVSTNNGTIVGGVTYTPGIVGNAFQFDGSTGYVRLPNNSLNLTGDFSISLWYYVKQVNDQAFISNRQVSGGNSYGWQLYYNSGWLYFYIFNGTSTSSGAGFEAGFTANTWVHITMVRKAGTSTNFYINGVLRTSGAVGVATTDPVYTVNQNYCAIGNVWNGTILDSYVKSGAKIDALTTWTKELTQDEITQLYNMGGGVQYPFTTQTIKAPYSVYNGDNLIDPIGAKNATIVGGVTYSVGKIGNAYTFDGSTGYLTLPSTSLNFQGKSFSFSMWLKFNGTPANYATILSNCFTSKGFYLGVISGVLYMTMGNGTGTSPQIQGPAVSNFVNQWGHITFVWEHGVGMKFYLNGQLFNSVANTTTIDFTSLTTLPNIGRKVDGGGWGLLNGSIDGLTFWDSALTPPEVITLFNDGTGMEYPYSSTLPAKLPSFNDAVGTGHGTSPATAVPSFSTGKIGKAFLFDGINDHILLPSTALRFTGDFTVSLWVYIPTNSSTNQSLIGCQRQPSVLTGWNIELYQNSIYFAFGTGSTRKSYAYTNNSNIGAWKHITATFKNGTGGKLYIDGVLQGTITTSNPIVYDSVHTPSIGAMKYAPNTTWYVQNGTKMDAISTWTKELTATEITTLYNSGNGKQYPGY
jgi:hypothetical protein